jgi:hypothetical protein
MKSNQGTPPKNAYSLNFLCPISLFNTYRIRVRKEQLQQPRYHHRSSLLPCLPSLSLLLLFSQPACECSSRGPAHTVGPVP